MRTFGRKLSGTSTRGEWPALCDYCGSAWPRKELRRDGTGLLACPQEGDGPDLRTRQRETLALQRSLKDHVTSYDGAAYHFPPTVYADADVESLLLQQVSTEDMLFAFCPGERVSGAYSGPLLYARPSGTPDLPPEAIGYLTNNRIDHSALSDLAHGGDAYCSRICDQLGSGFDLMQTVPDYQPQILDGGQLITEGNDQPVATFDGANHGMTAGVPPQFPIGGPYTVVVVYRRLVEPAVNGVLFELGKEPFQLSGPSPGTRIAAYWQGITPSTTIVDIDGGDSSRPLSAATAGLSDVTVVYDQWASVSAAKVYVSGTEIAHSVGINASLKLAMEPAGNQFSIAMDLGGAQLSSVAFAAAFGWSRALDASELDVVFSWIRDRV